MPLNKDVPQYILALDSAVNGCGVCVYDAINDKPLSSISRPMHRGQAEALVPIVQECIKNSGVEFSALDLIATTKGPGTFTGLRVGLSAAQSFALSLSLPLIGFSTLEILAKAYIERGLPDSDICVLIESKRQDFYCQFFSASGEKKSEPSALPSEEIVKQLTMNTFIIIGDGYERFSLENDILALNHQFESGFEQPDPIILSKCAAESYLETDSLDKVDPLYLRGADVSQPKSKPRTLANSNK